MCPACNFANPADYRFCGMCGTPLLLAVELQPPPEDELSLPINREGQPEGSGLVVPITMPLEGERRVATVILADVFGSTDLLEQMGSEAWVEMMNRVLQILEAEVYRFGGQVDQFRGDGLVALFGARSAHEDDPERAVLAALRMQEALLPYTAELATNQAIKLQLRVGVNTGEVIVTSIGDSQQHREETAMGEAVALAARLESAAVPGTVLVSENTYRLVSSHFEWQALGEVAIRGLSQPVAVYRPLAAKSNTERPHRLQAYGLSPPLIGREAESQILERAVYDLGDGRGSIILVSGDEGIGKSYLVNEMRQHVFRDCALLNEAHAHDMDKQRPPLTSLVWLQGRCRSYDHSSPYSMWLDLLRNWLGVHSGEPETATRERLYHQAQGLWGEQVADYYPYLAAFLSLPLEEPYAARVKHLDAGGLRQQFFWTMQKWVEAMAQRGPLVLVFGDVHWADATSLDLLEHCLPLCDYEPLLWLLVFRPERSSAVWELRHRVETEYPHRVTSLALSPLSEAQSGEMIDQLIGKEVLPAATRELILNQAEGNPYYIEELIHALIEQRALVHDEQTGQWRATHTVAAIQLPDTLQSLLLARLDSLSAEERRLLQMAAVIGSTFWSHVLQALFGDPNRLKQHLTHLQREQLIQERGQHPDLGMEYTFQFKLMRDVAYDSILSQQRAGYHHQVADFLEQHFGRDVPVYYFGLLAYHYRQARAQGKELFYTRLAAQQAATMYANTEAVELYSRALALLEEMETQTAEPNRLYAIHSQRFEVFNERRDVLYRLGDFKAGTADAAALLPLAQQLADDPAWLIDALLQQPGVAYWTSREELNTGMALAEQALTLAQQLGDQRREMQCLHTISQQRHFLEDDKWDEAGQRALELARQLNDQQYQVRILTRMGAAYSWSDQPERGMEYLEAALPICQVLDDRITEVHLLNLLGLRAERLGDYNRLLVEHQEKALAISREIGYRWGEAEALVACGQTRGIYLGDFEGGLAQLVRARQMREGLPHELAPLLRITQIQTMRAEYPAALTTLEQAYHKVEQSISDMMQAGLRLVAAGLYNALGEEAHLRGVVELGQEVRQLVADSPMITRQYGIAAACQSAVAHLGLAAYTTDEGENQAHCEQALQLSQMALEMYQTLGFVQIIECVSEEVLFCHSRALGANGRHAEAAEYLQQAHQEMIRKHNLIPADSLFRHTYLENIPLHRHLRAAYSSTV
jgi:class 3 adenylate cyclase